MLYKKVIELRVKSFNISIDILHNRFQCSEP